MSVSSSSGSENFLWEDGAEEESDLSEPEDDAMVVEVTTEPKYDSTRDAKRDYLSKLHRIKATRRKKPLDALKRKRLLAVHKAEVVVFWARLRRLDSCCRREASKDAANAVFAALDLDLDLSRRGLRSALETAVAMYEKNSKRRFGCDEAHGLQKRAMKGT